MVVGDNGVLTRAQDASKKTDEASKQEQRDMAMAEAAMNFEKTEFEDPSSHKKISIPEGFAVSPVDGENTIEDGLVIIDSKGNEFVWIPVENYENFKRLPGYLDGVLEDDSVDFTRHTEVNDQGYGGKSETETTRQEAIKMYESVKINKGFFIGRYETGNDGGKFNIETQTWDNNGKIVVKKNMPVYNYIKWGNSMEDDTGGAVQLARNFCKDNGYKDVTSTLTYAVQWDAAMQFFDADYLTSSCGDNSYVKNSTGKGNYKNEDGSYSIKKTGSNENYKVKNIYDMAGNVREWTMEARNATHRTGRGGNAKTSTGFLSPASNRNDGDLPEAVFENNGFRICLYLN